MEKKMFKRTYPILLVLAVLLTACGGQQATPTMAPVDMQNTAIAAAWTMVAATQQAQPPTNTALPPTEIPSPTPLPTFTPQPLQVLASPTSQFIVPPTPTKIVNANANPCLQMMDIGSAGYTKRVRVQNETGGTISPFSMQIWTPNSFGQCGFMPSYTLGRNESVSFEIPNGSWYVEAYITLKNGKNVSKYNSFVTGDGRSKDLISIVITENLIKIIFP